MKKKIKLIMSVLIPIFVILVVVFGLYKMNGINTHEYLLDNNGNKLIDESGRPVEIKLDENGVPIVVENGKPVLSENDNLIFVLLDDDGKPILDDGYPIKCEKFDDLDPEVESEMLQNVLNKFNIYIIRKSEATEEKMAELLNTLKVGTVILTDDDYSFAGTLTRYNNAKSDNNGNPIFNSIITNHKNIEKVLLYKYANEVLNNNTTVERVAEIANQDKKATYVATFDWQNETSLKDVPENAILKSYDVNTDENGNIKVYCYFK